MEHDGVLADLERDEERALSAPQVGSRPGVAAGEAAQLLRLENVPRPYAWGSTTALARLSGQQPTGMPQAELWFGTHPDAGTRSGGDLLADRVPPVPFLVKLLAAAAPLSIQVHPGRQSAREGFARENALGVPRQAADRSYRDENHKPELLIALEDGFEALAGLRSRGETLALLEVLGPAAAPWRERFQVEEDASALVEWSLAPEAAPARAELYQAIEQLTAAPAFAAEFRLLQRILRTYPGDPGVAVALLLNRVELARGEALFIDAGQLHSYVDGLAVEVMAASDNVVRGGLTSKHVDRQELLRVMRAEPGAPPRLVGRQDELGTWYRPVPDFEVLHASVRGQLTLPRRGPSIAVVVAGELRLHACHTAIPGGSDSGAPGMILRAGEAAYLAPQSWELRGHGEIILTQ